MSKTRYLQRLGQSWYVRIKVPAALRDRVQNTHIRRALGTRDLDEAVRRKWGTCGSKGALPISGSRGARPMPASEP